MTTPYRTEYGFIDLAPFPSRFHGTIRVRESSLAGHGPAVRVFTDVDHSSAPGDPPHLHLLISEARLLRDRLVEFISLAEAGETCEAEIAKGSVEEVDR